MDISIKIWNVIDGLQTGLEFGLIMLKKHTQNNTFGAYIIALYIQLKYVGVIYWGIHQLQKGISGENIWLQKQIKSEKCTHTHICEK